MCASGITRAALSRRSLASTRSSTPSAMAACWVIRASWPAPTMPTTGGDTGRERGTSGLFTTGQPTVGCTDGRPVIPGPAAPHRTPPPPHRRRDPACARGAPRPRRLGTDRAVPDRAAGRGPAMRRPGRALGRPGERDGERAAERGSPRREKGRRPAGYGRASVGGDAGEHPPHPHRGHLVVRVDRGGEGDHLGAPHGPLRRLSGERAHLRGTVPGTAAARALLVVDPDG